MPRKRYHYFGFLLLLGLSNCQDMGCQGGRFPLDPSALINVLKPTSSSLPTWEPVDQNFAQSVRIPRGYRSSQTLQISPGMVYRQFERSNSADPRYTLRVVMIQPKAFKQLQVLFSDRLDRPLYTEAVVQRQDLMGVLSWCFFGRIPAGDMIGKRCQQQGSNCQNGIYYLAEKRTGKDINQRYTVAINHYLQAKVFRGGLGPQSGRWYRLAMGGGILLYDNRLAPALYYKVGTPDYLRHYLSKTYNHPDIVRKGQAGDPNRSAPRSAMGTLAGGSLIFVNLGEGKYRFDGGATPAQMAVLMKSLGAVNAVMFDGGGAPQMVLNNRYGQKITRTYPEITPTSNYQYNYAFLTLLKP